MVSDTSIQYERTAHWYPSGMNDIQQDIVNMINRIRSQQHACTAGAGALELRCSKTWVVHHCELLRAQGKWHDVVARGGLP